MAGVAATGRCAASQASVAAHGIDPVHFGLVIVVNLTIGAVTPPVGTLMYTTTTILGTSLQGFVREAWPFVLALLAVLALITYVPALVLFLPNLLMG